MEYSPLLNPIFLIPSGIIVLLDILSFPLYLKWIREGQIQKSRKIFLLKPFSLTICVYFLFTQFGAAFFAGAWYCMTVPIIAVGMLLYYLAQIPREFRKYGTLTRADVVNFSLGILIILSTAAPSFLLRPITSWCDDINSAKIPVISEAVRKYYDENGKYPDEIKKLIPEYISTIPSPSCGVLSGNPREFELNHCEPPYVFVETIDFVGHDLYRLKDGAVIHLGSFFDNGPYQCP